MNKNIAIVIPHKGIGDILFHNNFIKSISKNEKKRVILIANKSSRADYLYKNSNYVKKIILTNLRRPNPFLYLFKTLQLILIISSNNIDKIYYTGKNKWQIFALEFLKYFFNAKYLNVDDNEKFIIEKLNNFLKVNKILNLNDYGLNLINLSKKEKKRIFINYKRPAVFININTSESQIDINEKKLKMIINKLNKKYKTIYINSNNNNKLENFYIKNINIIKTYKYNIQELCYLIKRSDLYIGTESGPAVIASLFGLRSFIFLSQNVKKESNLLPNSKSRKYYHIGKFNLFYKSL